MGFFFILLVSACSTLRYNGHSFTDHDEQVDGLRNIPKHGFMKTEGNNRICDGDSRLIAGYVVHLREPKSGETESEFSNYLEAEKIRAAVCSKVALWCDTRAHYFCRPDDDKCLKEHPNSTRNTCRMRTLDVMGSKQSLRSITQQVGDDSWIQCGGDSDQYASPLARTVVSNRAWVKDNGKWMKFCEQHRSKQECDQILKHRETETWFVWPDASRWAMTILMKNEPVVERDGDKWVGLIEVDLEPSCGLMENRF